MRRLKAQLMGMFSGKSQTPLDSTYLSDSATFGDDGRAGKASISWMALHQTLVQLLQFSVISDFEHAF